MPGEISFEVRLANGDVERADSLWSVWHIVARRAAFDTNPTNPVNVLPAEIWKLDPSKFGGRSYLETISTVAQLSERSESED